MPSDRENNILLYMLTQPRFSGWRHLLIVITFVPIALSQSFFAFGSSAVISTATIYVVGLCLAAATLASVYFNIYYLAPKYLSKGKYASYVIFLLLTVSVLILGKYMVEYLVFSNVGIQKQFNGITLLDALSNMMLYTVCIASSAIAFIFKQWIADNARIESLENRRLKNSIDDIKERIHPRFLYTTLQYASQKVRTEKEQASDTLFKLSELLRYQLYDCTRPRVLLGADIRSVHNYLLLVQRHSENKFSFDLSVEGNTNKLVAPALFTPWMEELIRQNPSALMVNFKIDDCRIQFECLVTGIDVTGCDFEKAVQKTALHYGNNAVIHQEKNAISIQLNLC